MTFQRAERLCRALTVATLPWRRCRGDAAPSGGTGTTPTPGGRWVTNPGNMSIAANKQRGSRPG